MEKEILGDEKVTLITKISSNSEISKIGQKGKKSLFSWLPFLAFVLLVSSLAVLIHFCLLSKKKDCVGVLQIEYSTRNVYLSSSKGGKEASYFGTLAMNLGRKPVQRKETPEGFEYSWENGVSLLIQKQSANCTSMKWEHLAWKDEGENGKYKYVTDCFDLKGKNWFGGGELYKQKWPLEGAEVDFAPYYPQDIIAAYSSHPAFGPVLGRYWITSTGTAILVSQRSPLLVSINSKGNGSLCFTIDPSRYPSSVTPTLEYKICQAENVKKIHQAMLMQFFKKPSKGPDVKMMRDPVWSTWVRYGKGVNQSDITKFHQEIVANNFNCSQIEIDDMYTTAYGDFDFDPVKFPSPKDLIADIHKTGCRVTTWVHPFANLNSKALVEGEKYGYFVVGPDGRSPGLLYWWNGIGAAVDFTNPEAYDWYYKQLKAFQTEYGIDSFKFDAGSISYLPYQYQLNDSRAMPSNYSVAYATLASQINNMVEVRVGDNSQDLPVFVRFLDRESSWSDVMGLQSVIPTVLTFGILGYPFILPDMIGGNGHPDKELFVRWLQLNAFLPVMQFSHVPWDFDNETMNITQRMMKIREAIFPVFLDGVSNAVKTGEPIIRPLWWIAPNDQVALKINQQFMIMDVYLVAPVTQSGATRISVYLPQGKWMEQFGNMTVHTMDKGGDITYPVTLSDVFYFKNVTEVIE